HLNHPTPRHPTNPQRQINRQRTRRDHPRPQHPNRLSPQPHDRTLTKLPLNSRNRRAQRLFAWVVHGGTTSVRPTPGGLPCQEYLLLERSVRSMYWSGGVALWHAPGSASVEPSRVGPSSAARTEGGGSDS